MARTYHRSVSTSAEPSRANWDPDQPRECHYCGEKVRITKDNIYMQRHPHRRTFHIECLVMWLNDDE